MQDEGSEVEVKLDGNPLQKGKETKLDVGTTISYGSTEYKASLSCFTNHASWCVLPMWGCKRCALMHAWLEACWIFIKPLYLKDGNSPLCSQILPLGYAMLHIFAEKPRRRPNNGECVWGAYAAGCTLLTEHAVAPAGPQECRGTCLSRL